MPEGEQEIIIPESEYRIDFVRSSGPGGQNVNKVNTKAQLRWNIGQSAVFTPEQKDRIRKILKNKINKDDELVLYSEKERSQLQNKEFVIEMLHKLVWQALVIQKPRRKTRPTRGSVERRIESKKIQASKKKMRGKIEF